MKVVLFCGGQGMRIRDYSEQIPKPMICIGYRPILWHVMKYYAHFGHKDFILCLGYKADYIKKYFLNYDECLSNDFVLKAGGNHVQLLNRDIDDWTITFVDTGMETNIGGRLRAVRRYVENEPMFLANYSDALTDLDLSEMVRDFQCQPAAVASFLCVRPCTTFHLVNIDGDSRVVSITDVRHSNIWINGGYFILRPEIFDYMRDGEELVSEPFERLIAESRLRAFHYEQFWQCMDTFKDKQEFEDMYTRGRAPWELWKPGHGIENIQELRIQENGIALQL
ncbi:glucose-1-phosphate cytidylyltransferase [bacterium]|nr:glucose-1-phosphate cytidylyltransferase [bacterium]